MPAHYIVFKAMHTVGKASATFFSLIETAKANGLEPYAYLRHIFKKLPLAQTKQDLKDLLPQNIDPTTIAVIASD